MVNEFKEHHVHVMVDISNDMIFTRSFFSPFFWFYFSNLNLFKNVFIFAYS